MSQAGLLATSASSLTKWALAPYQSQQWVRVGVEGGGWSRAGILSTMGDHVHRWLRRDPAHTTPHYLTQLSLPIGEVTHIYCWWSIWHPIILEHSFQFVIFHNICLTQYLK